MTVRIIRDDDDKDRCFAIRREVFIEEQQVPEDEEWDDLDDICVHFLAVPTPDAPPAEGVGTARLYLPDDEEPAKAQRIAVVAAGRKRGIGRELMLAVEDEARRRGRREMVLGAQVQAMPFYEGLGYVAYGELYDDAGIPHRWMKKHLREDSHLNRRPSLREDSENRS